MPKSATVIYAWVRITLVLIIITFFSNLIRFHLSQFGCHRYELLSPLPVRYHFPLLSTTEAFVIYMVHYTSFMVVVLLVIYVLITLLLWETIKYQIPKLSNLVKSKWLIIWFVTRVARRVPLVKQELPILPEYLCLPPVFSGVFCCPALRILCNVL